MPRRTHQTHSNLKALIGVVVLAVAFFAGSDGRSMEDSLGLSAEAQLAQSIKRQATGETKETGSGDRRKTAEEAVETGSEDRRKTAGAVDRSRTRRGRPLTIRQKRIFVLGLGASEKN